eukprot:3372626-Rhodomonas_salina.2
MFGSAPKEKIGSSALEPSTNIKVGGLLSKVHTLPEGSGVASAPAGLLLLASTPGGSIAFVRMGHRKSGCVESTRGATRELKGTGRANGEGASHAAGCQQAHHRQQPWAARRHGFRGHAKR